MEQLLDLAVLRDEVEARLKEIIFQSIPSEYQGLRPILTYHMGWEEGDSDLDIKGKRIRPLLVLLCTQAAGGEWQKALPAAAAAELIHNFSLIHDDIQDQSPLRHGRETVWVKWGVAQAINAGDLLFTLAFVALRDLKANLSPEGALDAHQVLESTCIRLTGGQHLDLFYERLKTLPQESYWSMIGGKTAALLACCAELGALVAGVDQPHRQAFREFGYQLGLAFQVQDDWLGIWGDRTRTGKSIESDLVSGKKTLPVVYAISQNREFAERWHKGMIVPEEVSELSKLLEEEGAKKYTKDNVERLTLQALEALDRAAIDNLGKQQLFALAKNLLYREY